MGKLDYKKFCESSNLPPWKMVRSGRIINSIDGTNYKSFVYQITNRVTMMRYIGRKNLTRKARGKVMESNWRNYWGSCTELHRDIAKFGHENFRREILEFCPSEAVSKYVETKFICARNALELPLEYYNSFLMSGRVSRASLLAHG